MLRQVVVVLALVVAWAVVHQNDSLVGKLSVVAKPYLSGEDGRAPIE